ncbi:MAG: Extracellular ligand-binding receptor, partial [candidate division TM6 bacterium GW2011_GWF2_38_10]
QESAQTPLLQAPIQEISDPFYQPLTFTKLADNRQEVLLNASLPLAGELSLIGNQIFDGLTLFFNKVRQEDLQGKYVINLSALDDQGSGSRTKNNAKKLQSRAPLFTSFFGANSMHAVAKLIKQKKIAMFFPIESASDYRQQAFDNIIFFRPPINKELDALIQYCIQQLKRKIAIFYEASSWGEEGLQHIKKTLEKNDAITLVAHGSYQPRTVNIASAVHTIVKSDPDAIICIAQARPAYNFIRQVVNKGLHKTLFLGLSELISLQSTLKKSRGLTVITSSVTPNPSTSTLPIVEEYRNDMKKFFPNKPLLPFSLEGYINAMLFYAALNYTPAPQSPQALIKTLESFNSFNFKGLDLTYNTTTRSLSSKVWINTGTKKWIEAQPLS